MARARHAAAAAAAAALLLLCLLRQATAQQATGCMPGDGLFAGDWARAGAKLTLVKTGASTGNVGCSRNLLVEMGDAPRFHSNPYASELAIIVNFPPGPALTVPYVMGQRTYNVSLVLPTLPCTAVQSCADYIGGICDQQGVGFYYQLRMRRESNCPGANEFIGMRDGESFDAPATNFNPDPAAACMPGNAASYDEVDDAIQDLVASLRPHATLAGQCSWVVNLTLPAGPRFRDSDYIDMVSFRGVGYGAGTRLFFKGQPLYTATLPGPASCADTTLTVDLLLLNEFLGAYPNIVTGYSTCPFDPFKTYTLNNGQRYSLVNASSGPASGGNTSGTAYPFPTDAQCTTAQPPQQLACPAMLSSDEVRRGLGAFYDATCTTRGGSWGVYTFPGGQSCCRTCRWNKVDAVAAWLQPSELDDCPPCVKAWYEAANGGPVTVVPLAPLVNDAQCPFPKPPGGDMSLPSWLYFAGTSKCYYKSSFAKGISGNIADAKRRCQDLHGGARLLKVASQAEDDFVVKNLLWTGFFGETYTGLSKLGRINPNNTIPVWTWEDGSVLQATDFQRWSPGERGFNYVEDEPVCMEYLPQQPKTWNPFSCGVNKHYICELPATNGTAYTPPTGPVAPPPVAPPPVAPPPVAPAPSSGCSNLPGQPAGAVATVAAINAGGPALCNFTADTAAAPRATGGVADNWAGRAPACSTATTSLACSVRFGGAFSYTIATTPGNRYTVRLTFAEVYWTAAGQRLLDVQVNGAVQLAGVDPFALAGAQFVPATREFNVTASGASFVFGFQTRADNAAVAAVEVFDMGLAPPGTPPTGPVAPPPVAPPPVAPPPVAPAPSGGCSSLSGQPAGAVATVAAINAGGPALCNFTADTAAAPRAAGGVADNWAGRAPACSTATTSLACSVRFGGAFSYTIATTPGNRYTVRLTFAEVYWTAAGQRLLDVQVNGAVQLAGVDPFALAGAQFVPATREFNVMASGASFVLGFQTRADNAAVAAVEVFDMGLAPPGTPPTGPVAPPPVAPPPVAPPPVAPAPSGGCSSLSGQPAGAVATVAAINAGGPALCNFTADTAAAPRAAGGVADNWAGRAPACSTATTSLACSVRFGGAFSYTIATTPGNRYTVRLTFAEVYWTAAGQRLLDVQVNGAVQLAGVDPFALAGAQFVPATREFNVMASGASFVLGFQTRADNAAVAAVEVFDMGLAPPGTPPTGPVAPPPVAPPPVAPPPVAPAPSGGCSSLSGQPAGAVATVAAINAGGPALCNFTADTAAAPRAAGGVADNWAGRAPACSTATTSLACSVRFGGAFSYTIATTPGNRYTVRLTFAEVYWTAAGQRLLDVQVNGAVQLAGVDPFALAGAQFVPATREFNVMASGASFVLGFQTRADNAAVAAVEVFDMGLAPPGTPPTGPVAPPPVAPPPVAPPPVAPAPSGGCSSLSGQPAGAVATVAAINAGGPALCNFTADTAAAPRATGGVADNWAGRAPACSTATTSLACSVRFGGAFSYTIATTPGNRYTVRLTFAEVYWTAAGQRLLDVQVNGAVQLAGVDPFALAGAQFVPATREFNVTASGASFVLGFQTRADNAAVAAVEVFNMGAA